MDDAMWRQIVWRLSLAPTASRMRLQALADVDRERQDAMPASVADKG
jgi:hypothetical protein